MAGTSKYSRLIRSYYGRSMMHEFILILCGMGISLLLVIVGLAIFYKVERAPRCFRTNPDPIAKGYLECVECSVREECER